MAGTDRGSTLIVLKNSVRFGEINAKYIYCRPELDANSTLSGVVTGIDLGLDAASGVRLVVSADNIDAWAYDITPGSLDTLLGTATDTLWGYLDLNP